MALLGWIGMGRIGTQMALLLLRAGHQLVVYDVDARRLAPALDLGARAANSPAKVAAASEATLLSVTDTDAVDAIVFGPEGIASVAHAGQFLVDHTSIDPERTRAMSAQLKRMSGMGWVDAPVSGSPGVSLAVFMGGESADVERARPWIASYAQKITHVGPIGTGQLTKSCNQAIVCATLAAWSEVLAYARHFGLEPETLMRAVEGGGADSSVRRHFAADLLAQQLPPETMRNLSKDIETMRKMARSA
ncbi:MAG TPA: NAD(P)-dependent oxidoreductase, partial [Stellaceae bacterium]|nr:NAD(P)-dependent oxidoreductase [Stellaceae bacterium]